MTRADERPLALLARHGWNSTAFQTVKAGCSFFFDGDDACVAYLDTGSAWVAAGAPIAAPDRIAAAVRAFVAAAEAAGRRCSFFAAERRLVDATDGLRALEIGEQPAWDPRAWPDILADHRSLREQLRRARAKGVRTRQLSATDLHADATRAAVRRLSKRWLATRGMAAMAFLVRLDPFALARHQSFFVAERDGRLVGFAVVLPVPARRGWFIETLIRDPSAPNGTGELLVDAVMRWAAASEGEWVTLGLAPLAGEVPLPLRVARRGARPLYDFEGLRSYKAKLRPTDWQTIYLAFPARQSAVASIVDALRAFTGNGFARFAWRSFVRGPTAVLRVLALLLVPWTMLIAVAPTRHWFGAPWVKWGWVAFDVLIAAGIFRLMRRPSITLGAALAVAVTCDALATATQAVLWNLPSATSGFDYAMTAVACAAPTIAAIALWGAQRRRITLGSHDAGARAPG
ncbi:MAG: DUF2156 domain-containing protein [Deltaproteobacteria bacterium]|nr:DUF2156 domain-containing protein [Deltaproteobacteria bacterium]